MVSNGSKPTPHLRVLLSGPAATEVEATLEYEPAISVRRGRRGRRSLIGRRRRARARVFLRPQPGRRGGTPARGHGRPAHPRRVRRAERDRRDGPRSRRGRRPRPAAAGRDAALRDPQGGDRGRGHVDRQGGHRLLAEGRERQDRAGDEPRSRSRALGREDAPRRPRPAVRRLRADARGRRRGRRSPTSRRPPATSTPRS